MVACLHHDAEDTHRGPGREPPINHTRRVSAAHHRIGKGRPQRQRASARVEPTAETIRQWIKQAALDDGLRSDGLTTSESEELNQLRRKNRVLGEEREILAKAAAGVNPSDTDFRHCLAQRALHEMWSYPVSVDGVGLYQRPAPRRERSCGPI
jgi:transposase-like protein